MKKFGHTFVLMSAPLLVLKIVYMKTILYFTAFFLEHPVNAQETNCNSHSKSVEYSLSSNFDF